MLFQTALSKEQLPASFVEHPAHSLLAARGEKKKDFFKQIALTANGIISKTFEK